MSVALLAFHRTGYLNRLPKQQQLLGNGGFTGIRVRNNREGAAQVNGISLEGHVQQQGKQTGGDYSGVAVYRAAYSRCFLILLTHHEQKKSPATDNFCHFHADIVMLTTAPTYLQTA